MKQLLALQSKSFVTNKYNIGISTRVLREIFAYQREMCTVK